ncbi:hypothetical protein KUTeg_005546 [Tegillarca granosa]|uniref:TRIM56 n=1 Tax=Tegillarca granosa TaxID=220873 RepID=A0ABQ9FLX3_TEGGR|nr:hypothetical protein KUTeg_005546 [Tegillarca granosa]
MATAVNDGDDPDDEDQQEIITCPICFEIYKKPMYLPCLHTFCETCLKQYITSRFKTLPSKTDINKPKSFPCPICRLDVPVSDLCHSAENTLSKLPSNHFIATLLDQHRLKTKEKQCDPCLIFEKHNPAVSWCTVCNELLCTNCDVCHRAMKATQGHKICPIRKIKSETKSITTLEFCTQHEDKRTELYCMDHKQPCCSICVTVHYHKCEHVKTLNNAAKGIPDSQEIREFSAFLKTMIDWLPTVLEGRKSNQKLLEKEKQQYQDKIRKMRENINKHLDQLEGRLNQELDGKYKESSKLIENDISEIESNLKVMRNYQKVLDTGLKNVSDIHKFLEVNKIKQQHYECSELLKNRLNKMKNHEVEIQFENNWMNLISKLTKIGSVICTSSSLDLKLDWTVLGDTGKKNPRNCTARKIFNFSAGNGLTDGIFLPNDNVLLADYDGRKVIFCTLEGQVHKELSLSGRPCGIAEIDDREAAVVLKNTQNIQYIDLVNCKLGKLITVNQKLYRAIGYNGTNWNVGGYGGNIYIIDRTGNIIKTVTSGCSSTNCIACTTDRIYLTPGDELVCLDMKRSKMFSYTNDNFRGGRGISVDKEGNIYCCGYWSNNIHQLAPNGQFIKLIVTDIAQPFGIAFDKTGERFLVTHGKIEVTVFELQQ